MPSSRGPGTESDVERSLNALEAARSLPEVMATATRAVRRHLAADGVTFVLREGELCYYAEEDAISPLWKGRRFSMSECISGWCMEHRRSVFIPDIYKDPRIPRDAYRLTFVRSLAMVPLPPSDPIAAMGAYWSRVRDITWPEYGTLFAFANAISESRLGSRRPR